MSLDESLKDFLDSSAASAAFDSVQDNLTEILATIRQGNNMAKILVAIQYDPYRWMSEPKDQDPFKGQITALKTTFTAGVEALNTYIQAAVAAVNDSNVSVVDVWSAFEGSTNNLCNAYYNGIITDFSFDFHPNQAGHDQISETITAKLFEGLYLRVGGQMVTSENFTNVLGDEGATVTYAPVTNTLTLDGANITTSDGNTIYATSDLNIVLKGKSTIVNNNIRQHRVRFGC